jgi:lipopolysaccharide transport system permease protein
MLQNNQVRMGDTTAITVRVIEPRSKWRLPDIKELWRFRDLLYFLAWRDVIVRYKQTVLGILWAILQPFLKLVVFTVVFGRLVGVQSDGSPYAVFIFAGLLPWQFFSEALTRSSQSLVGNVNLVTKVSFPRIILPIATTGAVLVDFVFSFLVLVGLMFWYGIVPGWSFLAVIPLTFLTAFVALGVGVLLSALTVFYRDFRYVVPFGLQLWLFLTPVIYSVKIIPEEWRWIIALNPMTGVVDAFRSAVLGTPFDVPTLVLSTAVAGLLLLVSLLYFSRTEDAFADAI